ncbi:protein disulfide-isomerase [Clonorchis sinensis]|uniref:Protein disulfide-isomerase n=1 Tax=Clonorchis sinensis TaxID=79923 RepID=G7Y792_CLOSI|nr:protein disulfide-isomerase [Clonorchis sinensis]
MVAGLKFMYYETRLAALGLFPLKYRCLRGDLILTHTLVEQGLANRFFTADPANTRRGHDYFPPTPERELLIDLKDRAVWLKREMAKVLREMANLQVSATATERKPRDSGGTSSYPVDQEGAATSDCPVTPPKNPRTASSSYQCLLELLNLYMITPQREVQKFDGNPPNYWKFLRGFTSGVAQYVTDPANCLAFLIDACEGEARETIDHNTVFEPEHGYQDACKMLGRRFGNPSVIARQHSASVTTWPPVRENDASSLLKLAGTVKACCGEMHYLDQCAQLVRLDAYSRATFVCSAVRCEHCPKPRHKAKQCRSRRCCGLNGREGLHHPLLYPPTQPSAKSARPTCQEECRSDLTVNCASGSSGRTTVALGVLPVTLRGPRGVCRVNALLDSGSDSTMLKEDVALNLGLSELPTNISVATLNGQNEVSTTRDGVPVTAPVLGWRRCKKWRLIDVSGVHAVSFFPDCLIEQLEVGETLQRHLGILFNSVKQPVSDVCILEQLDTGYKMRNLVTETDE